MKRLGSNQRVLFTTICISLISACTGSPTRCGTNAQSTKPEVVLDFERFAYPGFNDEDRTYCTRPPVKIEQQNPTDIDDLEPGPSGQASAGSNKCNGIGSNWRFDCHPEDGATQSACESRGCCWVTPRKRDLESLKDGSIGVPACFYPTDFPTYSIYNSTTNGTTKVIFLKRSRPSYYPEDIMLLRMDIVTSDVAANIKVYDPLKKRYVVPIPYPGLPKDKLSSNSLLDVIVEKPFTIKIIKKATGETLFDASVGPLLYTDQFIQFSSSLPSKYLYGLGERRDNFLRSFNWQRFTMFAADQMPRDNSNLYGTHPFYVNLLKNGEAHGTLVLNSNAMEVILQPAPAITFRLLGGIIDIYTFAGPSPADVVKQYTEFIGRPTLPPYWALGFHLSRWNYGNTNTTRATWERTRDAKIPFDVQWNDIDYMDQQRDFTYDKKNFAGLPQLVDDIHKAGMHYVPIIDPAVDVPPTPGTYSPYDNGIAQGIFINGSDGKPFVGKVWPPHGAVWPDFTNPKTESYWTQQLSNYHREVPYDGLWIDMNEPSNFYNGTTEGCPSSKYENPPYTPAGLNGGMMSHLTVCMTAQQHSSIHYNVHNLYGITEAIATNSALKTIRNKRPFIISRSTFPGHGHYAGHWSGDIRSTWDDMRKTIPALLDFSMFGIPLMGADICGFNQNTTAKLCQRWMELGAFYPFSRNHNTNNTIEQDPVALGPEVIESSIRALRARYTLLPHLYTQFYRAAQFGETVARPLFFEFPKDKNTYGIDKQFLWGPSLMIIPVLEEDATRVEAYFPAGTWYMFNSLEVIRSEGEIYAIDTPLNTINLAVRAGHIIPIQETESTTTESRKNQFGLFVALDTQGYAKGQLYWDDGDSLGTLETGSYNLLNFVASQNTVTAEVDKHGAKGEAMTLGYVMVLGVSQKPTSVLVNNKPCSFKYDQVLQVLIIANGLAVPMAENGFKITWS